MRITQIVEATGFKNLELKETPLARRTLVHGPNNCGKSNLLVLLEFLFKSKSRPGDKEPTFAIEGFDATTDVLRRKGGKVLPKSRVVVKLDCWGERFNQALANAGFLPPKTGDKKPARISAPCTLAFEISRLGSGTTTVVHSIMLSGKEVYNLKGTPDPGLLEALQGWVRHELKDSVVYVPNGRITSRDPVPLTHLDSISPVRDLENAIYRFKNDPTFDSTVQTEIRGQLEHFFKLQDFRSEVPPTKDEKTTATVSIGLMTEDLDWFSLKNMGTGVQQLLVILSQLQVHPNAQVALIEEFETSLSTPNRNLMLEQFLRLTADGGPLRQIIATSHNTFRPPQPEFISIGAKKLGTLVNFIEWNEDTWKKFQITNEVPSQDDQAAFLTHVPNTIRSHSETRGKVAPASSDGKSGRTTKRKMS